MLKDLEIVSVKIVKQIDGFYVASRKSRAGHCGGVGPSEMEEGSTGAASVRRAGNWDLWPPLEEGECEEKIIKPLDDCDIS
jgi:hypothetical protein